jgi:hypothetical protein
MIDGTDFIAGGEPFGLMRNDKTMRPVYWAYRATTRLFAGVTSGKLAIDPKTDVYTVTLTKPGATITVAWDQSPKAGSVSIAALAPSALVYDKLGTSRSAAAKSGHYMFNLAPSTGNTNPHDPKDFVLGGNPVILVQTH